MLLLAKNLLQCSQRTSRLLQVLTNHQVPHSYLSAPCKNITHGQSSSLMKWYPGILPKTSLTHPGFWCNKFHTSPRRNAPPLVWMFVRVIAQAGSILGGRALRKRWQRLSDKDREGIKNHLWNNKWFLSSVGLVLGLFCAIDFVTHVQETPITKRKRYIAFTEKQFMQIAEYEYKMQYEAMKDQIVSPNHPVYGTVTRVTQNIINSNQDLDLLKRQIWTVVVVDSADENAFVLPTGHIFVNTGILKRMQSESQLAFLLSHELAHVILHHGAEKISTCQVIDKIIILAMAMIWFFIPTDGIAVITQMFFKKVIDLMLHLPYSRKLESEADEVGLHLMAKACYDVRQSSLFWNAMAINSDLPGNEGQIPEWLSTHPNHENRANRLDELIPQAIDLRTKCNCKILPPKDPRDEVELLKKMARGTTEEKSGHQSAPVAVQVRSS